MTSRRVAVLTYHIEALGVFDVVSDEDGQQNISFWPVWTSHLHAGYQHRQGQKYQYCSICPTDFDAGGGLLICSVHMCSDRYSVYRDSVLMLKFVFNFYCTRCIVQDVVHLYKCNSWITGSFSSCGVKYAFFFAKIGVVRVGLAELVWSRDSAKLGGRTCQAVHLRSYMRT